MALDPRGSVLRIVAVIVAIAVVAILGTRAYLADSRYAGDVILANGAIEGLVNVGNVASSAVDSTSYSNALEDYWMAVDLYLHTETRDVFPDVTASVERSWTAYLVADELWRVSDDGDTQPLVSEVYAAGRLLQSIPELEAVVVGEGADRRFDNTDMRAVDALFAAAASERAAAEALVGGLSAQLR